MKKADRPVSFCKTLLEESSPDGYTLRKGYVHHNHPDLPRVEAADSHLLAGEITPGQSQLSEQIRRTKSAGPSAERPPKRFRAAI